MTTYADYAYYTSTFLGTAIAEPDFPKLALRASNQIDRITFNRAAVEIDFSTVEKIKMATCQVAEELQSIDSLGGEDAIASESSGSYSVTYGTDSSKQRTNDNKIFDAAAEWLSNTGLLFRGFMDGEYGA